MAANRHKSVAFAPSAVASAPGRATPAVTRTKSVAFAPGKATPADVAVTRSKSIAFAPGRATLADVAVARSKSIAFAPGKATPADVAVARSKSTAAARDGGRPRMRRARTQGAIDPAELKPLPDGPRRRLDSAAHGGGRGSADLCSELMHSAELLQSATDGVGFGGLLGQRSAELPAGMALGAGGDLSDGAWRRQTWTSASRRLLAHDSARSSLLGGDEGSASDGAEFAEWDPERTASVVNRFDAAHTRSKKSKERLRQEHAHEVSRVVEFTKALTARHGSIQKAFRELAMSDRDFTCTGYLPIPDLRDALRNEGFEVELRLLAKIFGKAGWDDPLELSEFEWTLAAYVSEDMERKASFYFQPTAPIADTVPSVPWRLSETSSDGDFVPPMLSLAGSGGPAPDWAAEHEAPAAGAASPQQGAARTPGAEGPGPAPAPGSPCVGASPGGALRGRRTAPGVTTPEVCMPRTMSLLVFRNADRAHRGAVVFVKRWPPPDLRGLLEACAKACRPVAAPPTALLTAGLARVRSLQDISPQEVYLLKGAEMLDPPQLFFSHRSLACGGSLGQLDRARCTAEALHKGLPPTTPGGSRTSSQVLGPQSCGSSLQSLGPPERPRSQGSVQSLPTGRPRSQGSVQSLPARRPRSEPSLWPAAALEVFASADVTTAVQGPFSGTPPAWLVEGGARGAAGRIATWQASDKISMTLSWGGLNQSRSHKDFFDWGRVLDAPDAGPCLGR